MHDEEDRSARPRAPLWLRAVEAVGLLGLIIGLASGRWWLAGRGVAVVLLSYGLYRRRRGDAGSMESGNGGGVGYDFDASSDGGGDGGGGD